MQTIRTDYGNQLIYVCISMHKYIYNFNSQLTISVVKLPTMNIFLAESITKVLPITNQTVKTLRFKLKTNEPKEL